MLSTPLNDLKAKYELINTTKNTNRNTNKVTLDYKKLDTITVGQLKQAISLTINNCLKEEDYDISDSDKDYLNRILKQNTGSLQVEIDYDKIDTYQVKFSIKGQIQEVLKNRANQLYHDISLGNVRI